jgi:hypothetical protein
MPLLASLLFMILNKLIDAGRSSTTQKNTRTDCKLRQQDGAIFGQDVCTFQPLLEVCCLGSTGLVFTSSNLCTARAVLESNVRTAPTKTRTAAPIDDSITKVPSKQWCVCESLWWPLDTCNSAFRVIKCKIPMKILSFFQTYQFLRTSKGLGN